MRLSLPESGVKALAEERDKGMCYRGMLHCLLKMSLCTTYLVEVNKLKRIICIFTPLLQRADSLQLRFIQYLRQWVLITPASRQYLTLKIMNGFFLFKIM